MPGERKVNTKLVRESMLEPMEDERWQQTVKCPKSRCTGYIVRIERYNTDVEWELDAAGHWDLEAYDKGSHFHLHCTEGHETRMWGNDLPKRLEKVVYPG
jgi:hypothetical protein